MAIKRNGAATKYVFLHNGKRLKMAYHNGIIPLWSAGGIVTYRVDDGVAYTEEVDDGATCLAPTTFTPSKSGWTFVGWREDTTANGSVLSNKTMNSEPITLYAVYKQTITKTFASYNNTQKVTGTRYFNASGNYANPTITVPTNATYSGWTWRGWSAAGDSSANAGVSLNNGATIPNCTGDSTYYGLYQQTITHTYISHDATKDVTGTRYYNAAGNTINPTLTAPTGATYSGWTWRGWSANGVKTANADVSLANGASQTNCTANETRYGLYSQEITATFDSRNSTQKVTGTRYHNAAGNTNNASVVCPTGAAYSGWTWRGWSGNGVTTADASVAYANGATISNLTANTQYYGLYQAPVVVTAVVNGQSTPYTGTKYHSAAKVNKNPTFTIPDPTMDGCTFIGWTSTQGGTTITIPTVNELMSMVDVTLYAVFATHYYVKFSDYPLQEVSTDGNADYNIRTNAADYYIDVLRNPDSGYGIVVAKAVLPTNNCNKVRVKYTAYNGVDRQICGTYVDAGSSSITFNCSGDTFELTMRVVNSDSGNWATMTISEVYFYYEK